MNTYLEMGHTEHNGTYSQVKIHTFALLISFEIARTTKVLEAKIILMKVI